MSRQIVQGVSSAEDLFRLLETTNSSETVAEIKQLIQGQFSEVKDSWLVYGLFETYASSRSPRCLEILLSVRDPHDKYLCDKISECLRQTGKQRQLGLDVFGCVVRKHPSWLYKITQLSLMKDLIKVLKSEEDLVIMMNGLLALIALLPTLPVHITPFLIDVFEVFSRVASWRCFRLKNLPEIQQVHIQVALFAFFHRLYGMFPCNFLSYLRTQYSDDSSRDSYNDDHRRKCKENHVVFLEAIRPMLGTVRMHPLLVTHSRDQEKTPSRWKKMELHDVVVESSKYSLVNQESAKEDEYDHRKQENGHCIVAADLSTEIHKLLKHDPLWTPTRVCGVSTPPRHSAASTLAPAVLEGQCPISPNVISGLTLDSPPEPAIEATPESTPFVTPVKEEQLRNNRTTPSNQTNRQLRLDSAPPNVTSPSGASVSTPGSKSASVSSPMANKDVSPLRFPDIPQKINSRGSNTGLADLRRDSLFEAGQTSKLSLSRMSVDRGSSALLEVSGDEITGSLTDTLTPDASLSSSGQTQIAVSASLSAVAVSSSALLASATEASEPKKVDLSTLNAALEANQHHRPSPVRFTSQRPEQFPIMPKPERANPGPQIEREQKSGLVKHKMLSLETLKDALPDFGKEEDDDEVTKLTGGSDDPSSHQLGTRHITPQFCSGSSSAGNSRTTSRLSSSSQAEKGSRPTTSALSVENKTNQSQSAKEKTVCKFEIPPVPSVDSKGVSRERVGDFVRQAKGRMRNVTICGPEPASNGGFPDEKEQDGAEKTSSPPRALSCPTFENSDSKKVDEQPPETTADDKVAVDCQTDDGTLFSYEHLFPAILPQWVEVPQGSGKDDVLNPYDLLDQFIKASSETAGRSNGGSAGHGDGSRLKYLQDEVAMLHAQVLYERHRREALGIRNRRLLGKTKSARVIEEQNTALRDQLNMVASEMEMLYDQLEAVRKEKHEVEEDRAANAKQRDKEIERLNLENNSLKREKVQLKEKTLRQEEELKSGRLEMEKLGASYFNSNAEADILKKKEADRVRAEHELVELRKEVLLLGELLRKYRENSTETSGVNPEEAEGAMFLESFRHQVQQMEATLSSKSRELENYKCRVLELEQNVLKKDQVIQEQKRLLERTKVEGKESMLEAEESLKEVMEYNVQLEKRVVELQAQPKRPASSASGRSASIQTGCNSRNTASPISPGYGEVLNESADGIIPPTLPSATGVGIAYHSANVDIACRAPPAHRPPEKPSSFIVGSPPSSGGSNGSDHSEMIRRALASAGPINLEGIGEGSPTGRSSGMLGSRFDTASPEIGSALSAKEMLNRSGSFNGHQNQ